MFGFRRKAALNQPTRGGWTSILEPFAGAWQKNQSETRGSLTTYPTLYACLHRISTDMGKLPFQLVRKTADGIRIEANSSAYSPVLKRPNNYQTQQQFREAWALSRLMHGNTYVLKQRDNRNVVTALYILDPQRVLPKVAPSGDVFYELRHNSPANLLPEKYDTSSVVIPASEIIHDRLNCFHNQLIGVPPLASAYWPAVKNLSILRSAADFFSNHSQPGGILSAPAGMIESDAKELKDYWQNNYSGRNSGKIAVLGADVKFTPFAMKSVDAQLVEQMKYSDEQICQPFGIPPFIVGIGGLPAGLKADSLASIYLRFSLQANVEAMENLLNDGLGISPPLYVELNTDSLLRMEMQKRGEVFGGLVGAGIATPNEARAAFNFGPLEGGSTVYMQQQDVPLSVAAQVKPEPDQTQEAIDELHQPTEEAAA